MTADLYTLPDLPYDYGALEPHISAHHGAAPRQAPRRIRERARTPRSNGSTTSARRATSRRSRCSRRTWRSTSPATCCTRCSGPTSRPDGGGEPQGELAELLDATFGGFPAFRQQMTEAASTIQGAGWALASWEPVAARLVVQQVHDHQGNHGQGTIPLLAIDAWEHAYYLQYENRKTDFFAAIWNVVNWDDVAMRLAAARRPSNGA